MQKLHHPQGDAITCGINIRRQKPSRLREIADLELSISLLSASVEVAKAKLKLLTFQNAVDMRSRLAYDISHNKPREGE